MPDSLRPHGLYSPWNSPGQNTGVGSLSLLQGIFLTQESNRGLLHCRWILYPLSYWVFKRSLPYVIMIPIWRPSFGLWFFVLCHFSHVQLFMIPMDCSPPGSSIHGTLQTRIVEWVAMPSSRGSSWARDWTQVSCTAAGNFFTTSATLEAQVVALVTSKNGIL